MHSSKNGTEQTLDLNTSYIDVINGVYNSLNTMEQRIADYILKEGGNFSHRSAREVAESCGCSAASVVRFAKKLNYSGFPELKFHIQNAVAHHRQDDLKLTSSEKTHSMMQKALIYASLSLRNTVTEIQENQLDEAAAAILNAATVQLCAIGSAGGVALAASSQFLSFGINAVFPMDELQQIRCAACLKQRDVLIGINYNNAAKCVADAFMTAKKRGAITILITGIKSGLLSRYADYVFYTPTRRPNNALNISTSTLCQSMIIQLLILRMWQQNPTLFELETNRISNYTKMKLYDPSVEKINVSFNQQTR